MTSTAKVGDRSIARGQEAVGPGLQPTGLPGWSSLTQCVVALTSAGGGVARVKISFLQRSVLGHYS